jgi:hypothetical protein
MLWPIACVVVGGPPTPPVRILQSKRASRQSRTVATSGSPKAAALMHALLCLQSVVHRQRIPVQILQWSSRPRGPLWWGFVNSMSVVFDGCISSGSSTTRYCALHNSKARCRKLHERRQSPIHEMLGTSTELRRRKDAKSYNMRKVSYLDQKLPVPIHLNGSASGGLTNERIIHYSSPLPYKLSRVSKYVKRALQPTLLFQTNITTYESTTETNSIHYPAEPDTTKLRNYTSIWHHPAV